MIRLRTLLLGLLLLPTLVLAEFKTFTENDFSASGKVVWSFFEEKGDVFTPEKVLQMDSKEGISGASLKGFSPDLPYWARLSFQNINGNTSPQYLKLDNPMIDFLDIWVYQDDLLVKTYHLGDLDTKNNWQNSGNSGPFIKLPLYGKIDILLRLQSQGPMVSRAFLMGEGSFKTAERTSLIIWGAAAGIALILMIYNLFLFAFLRDRAYLLYSFYLLIALFHLSGLHGFGQAIWGVGLQSFISAHLITTSYLMAIVVTEFVIAFLRGRRYAPVSMGWIMRLRPVLWVTAIFSLWMSETLSAMIFMPLQLLLTFWAIRGSFEAVQSGYKAAQYYMVSWFPMLVGGVLGSALHWGFIGISSWSKYVFAAGILAEVILISMALAVRFREREEMRFQKASHDPLTDLPNQTYLEEWLNDLLQRETEERHLVLMRLGNLEEVTGVLGPDHADAVYAAIVRRLHHEIQDHPGVASLETGGVMKSCLASLPFRTIAFLTKPGADLTSILDEMQMSITAAFQYRQFSLHCTVSAGSACFPHQEFDAKELQRKALHALQTACNLEKFYEPYSDDMESNTARRMTILHGLQAALREKSFEIHIQPQVNLENYKVIGGEVLVRWQHPELGNISPAEFIPLAESSGLIHQITTQVLEKAVNLQQQLMKKDIDISLSVNFSAKDLENRELIDQIMTNLEDAQVPKDRMTAELTETTRLVDPERALELLQQLNTSGIKTALDDFGSGYSSMAQLSKFPVKEIKVDRQFISGIVDSERDHSIVEKMIELARSLGALVIAEGMEDAATAKKLRDMGCHCAQGFYFFKPMPVCELLQWFEENPERTWIGDLDIA